MANRYFESLDQYERQIAAKQIRAAMERTEQLAKRDQREVLGMEVRILEKLLRALEADE